MINKKPEEIRLSFRGFISILPLYRLLYRYNANIFYYSFRSFIQPLQLAKAERFRRYKPKFNFKIRMRSRFRKLRRIFLFCVEKFPMFAVKTKVRRFEIQFFHACRIDERRLLYKRRRSFFESFYDLLHDISKSGVFYRSGRFVYLNYNKSGDLYGDDIERVQINGYIYKQLGFYDIKYYKNTKKKKKL